VAGFLLELFIRGAVLWLLAVVALIVLRRTAAAYRHMLCVAALAGTLVLPMAQSLLPPLRLLPPARVAAAGSPAPARQAPGGANSGAETDSAAPQAADREPAGATLGLRLISPGRGGAAADRAGMAHLRIDGRTSDFALIVIWALGCALLLARLAAALLRLRRLQAGCRNVVVDGAAVLVGDSVSTPLTWGVRRSVILLPEALLSAAPAVPASALRHEQAHIARWDWFWNVLAEVACAVCWFQPGAWWLRRRMRLESERACDDLVLLSGIAAPDYAGHLVEILRSVRGEELAPAVTRSGEMEERMGHILDSNRPRQAHKMWLAASAPLALGLLSLAALRVSARPTERGRPFAGHTAAGSTTALPPQGVATAAAGRSDAPAASDGAAIMFEKTAWAPVVDGLEPGLLVTAPDLTNGARVPFNTHVTYKVLIRNVSGRTRVISFQCSNYGPWSGVPYLIPNDSIRKALRSRVLPQEFRANAVSDMAVATPSYGVRLAPGESVVVPEQFGLYVGTADKQAFPRVESVKAGSSWLVLPMSIQLLTSAADLDQFERTSSTPYSEKRATVTISRDGKITPRQVPIFGTGASPRQVFARVKLSLEAPANR
jgi:beta-lactamase regulating signal transducer with metallopeptidase domain